MGAQIAMQLAGVGFDLAKNYLFQGQVGLPIDQYGSLCQRFPGAEFTRYGGVLRIAAGDPLGRGGQIAAMLKDAPGFDPSQVVGGLLNMGANPIGSVVNAVGHVASTAMSYKAFEAANRAADLAEKARQAANMAAAFSGVGAVMSTLNLGVSIAGFVIVNKKLNQLKGDVADLRSLTEGGFKRIDDHMGRLEDRLVDLHLLTVAVHQDLGGMRAQVDGLHQRMNIALEGDLFGSFRTLQLCEANGDWKGATNQIQNLASLQHQYSLLISEGLKVKPGDWRSVAFLQNLSFFQFWAAALAAEARIYRQSNQTAHGAQVLRENLANYKALALAHARILMGETPADFVALFEDRYVMPTTLARWVSHMQPQPDLSAKDVLARQLAHRDRVLAQRSIQPHRYMESLPQDELRGRAEAIERLVGSVERLETYLLELEVCAKQQLPVSDWEQRLLPAAPQSSLYLVPVKADRRAS